MRTADSQKLRAFVIPSRADNASLARTEGPRERGVEYSSRACVIQERR